MREQRNAIRRLIRRSPSLKRGLEGTIADVYADALGRAIDQTGVSPAAFPDRLPYGIAEVLDPALEPSQPSRGHRSRRR